MIDAYVGIPGSGKTYMLVRRGITDWIKGYRKAQESHVRYLKSIGEYKKENVVVNMPPSANYKGLAADMDIDLDAVVRYLTVREKMNVKEAIILADTIKIIKTYQDLLDCMNMIILIAEAQLWFNARDFAMFPTEVLAFWTQSRHAGVDVIFDTQQFSMVDTNVRGLVANLYRATPTPFWFKVYSGLMVKLGLMSRIAGKLPVFRYQTWMSEEEGNIRKKSKGINEALGRTELARLDPLLAHCYRTRGMTYGPSNELHQLHNTKKSQVALQLGLKFDLSAWHKKLTPKGALLPALSVADTARAYLLGIPVHTLVAQLHAGLQNVTVYRSEPGTPGAFFDSSRLPVSFPAEAV